MWVGLGATAFIAYHGCLSAWRLRGGGTASFASTPGVMIGPWSGRRLVTVDLIAELTWAVQT